MALLHTQARFTDSIMGNHNRCLYNDGVQLLSLLILHFSVRELDDPSVTLDSLPHYYV